MLDHPHIAGDVRAEHRDLRQAACDFFTDRNVAGWCVRPDGFVAREFWNELGRQGFTGVSIPADMGGRGLALTGCIALLEAVSQLSDVGIALGLHVQNEVTSHWLLVSRNRALTKKYLPELARGRLVGCTCHTDTDPKNPTLVRRDGSLLRITGSKSYVVNAVHADLCFVVGELDGQKVTVLLDKATPGVGVGEIYDKFGSRRIDQASIVFDDVAVPVDNLVSAPGIQQLLQWNHVMTRARFCTAVDAYYRLRDLLAEARKVGRNKNVAGKPFFAHVVNRQAYANAWVDLVLLRAGIADGYRHLIQGRTPTARIAGLKGYAVDRLCNFAALCMDWQGGRAASTDNVFARAYVQALALRMVAGSQMTMRELANNSFQGRVEANAA